MRTFKINMPQEDGVMRLEELLSIQDHSFWQYIGNFKSERMAVYLLLAITNQVELSFANADRFERHFLVMNQRYPLTFTSKNVLEWLGEQVAARL